jgi:signal transduction histidine kinase
VVVNVFLVISQRSRLYDSAKKELYNEIQLMGTFVREPLLRNDYDEVEQFLLQWGEEHKEILIINAVMPNKFVLVQYNSLKDSPHSYKLENRVQYLKKDLMTIEVVKDFKHVDSILNILQWQLIIGSIVLSIFFGASLWFTIKKLAIKPLESIVNERTKELIEKNKELEQVMYASSHDLRSPLVNIDGYNKIISKGFEKIMSIIENNGVSGEIKEKVSKIVEEDIVESEQYISASVGKMSNLLAGLLYLSRVGRSELLKEKLDMNELINDIKNSMAYQFQETGTKLEIAELPSCIGDRTQVMQIFSNLIENALKYLDSNRSGLIKISGTTKHKESVYCVEDKGVGIALEHQEKIFEIFHQLEPEKSSGEGMGLTIVSKIIARHNGRVWVESERDKGSKFFISLPKE